MHYLNRILKMMARLFRFLQLQTDNIRDNHTSLPCQSSSNAHQVAWSLNTQYQMTIMCPSKQHKLYWFCAACHRKWSSSIPWLSVRSVFSKHLNGFNIFTMLNIDDQKIFKYINSIAANATIMSMKYFFLNLRLPGVFLYFGSVIGVSHDILSG